MKLNSISAAALAAFALLSAPQADALCVAERCFSAPTTVSPELARMIDREISASYSTPQSAEEWIRIREERAARIIRNVPQLYKMLGLSVKTVKLGGVDARELYPADIPRNHSQKVLLHFHGGAYCFNPREAGTTEAAYMAGIGRYKVVSLDYRMPPEHPFPAALDDAVAAYKELLKVYSPKEIGVFGTSAGGGLTFALLLKLKELNVPLPGAVVAGTPWVDLTETGDSFSTNAYVDNILVKYEGMLEDTAKLYAAGKDLKDPFISPIHGDVSGLPPVLLGAGTRDLFLSTTVLMQKKLRQAGVPADLIVLEGASHAHYMMIPPEADEARYYFTESMRHFERHLK